MYDKYNKALPITTGITLPDHKGLYLTHSSNANIIAEMKTANIDGGTHGITIPIVANTNNFIPLNVYKVTNLNSATGFLLY